MSIIDDIKADREAGTPGPWSAFTDDANNHTNIVAVVPLTSFVFSLPGRFKSEADVKRIARVPHLEDIVLAAEDLVEALQSLESGDDSIDGMAADIARGAIDKFREAAQ